jgi:opacity protein-like surface antigen
VRLVTVRPLPIVFFVATALAVIPAAGAAQSVVSYSGMFTPYIGVTAGDDVEDPGFAFGGSLSVLDNNGWGAELDVAHTTTLGDEGFDESGLTSAMLHVAYYWQRGLIRPYGVVGGGILRLSGIVGADGSRSRTDWGLSFGGGVNVPFNELVAVRGDVRYVRFLENHPDVLSGAAVFGAWRLTAGLTLSFPLEP